MTSTINSVINSTINAPGAGTAAATSGATGASSLGAVETPSYLRRSAGRAVRLLGRAIWKSAAIALFLLLWEFAPNHLLSESTSVFLPPFHVVAQAWWHLLQDGTTLVQFRASIGRSIVGFVLAVGVAVPLGLLLAWYRPLANFLTPLLELFRNTAALALLPVFTLLLGIGETSKIAIVVYASLFPVLLNTIAGVHTVDPLLIRAARSLGLSNFRLFQKVILPSAVPTIFTGIRMAGASSILVLIAAEMVGAKAGLGIYIQSTQSSFLIPQMYAGIITISVLGVAVNYGLVRLERHFSRWRTGAAAVH
jgi:NitT/TauT family transport system permease protein